MPKATIEAYLRRLPAVKAELKFLSLEAYSTVWMERRDKRSIIRQWQRAAFGELVKPKKATKGDMMRMGIGAE